MLGEFLLSLKTEEEKSRHKALPPIKTPACNNQRRPHGQLPTRHGRSQRGC